MESSSSKKSLYRADNNTHQTVPAHNGTDPNHQSTPTQRPARQINLLRGWPSPTLHPTELLRKAADRVFRRTYDKATPNPGLENPIITPLETSESTPLPTSSVDTSSRPLDYGSLALAEQALLYGPDPGHLPLRRALGKWLWEFYGPAIRRTYPGLDETSASGAKRERESPVHTDDSLLIPSSRITITGGASQSIDVIMSAVTDPTYTRKVWIVTPGYFMAFKIFRDAGFAAQGRMAGIPEKTFADGRGERGPDVAWLRRNMEQSEREWKESGKPLEPQLKPKTLYPKIYKHIIYTVPSFANPSSITTSKAVREDLVRCAREFDALIICDDVYDMLQWPATSPNESPNPLLREEPSLGVPPAPTPADVDKASSTDIAPLPRLVDIDRFLPPDTFPNASQPEGDDDDDDENNGYGNVVSNGSFSKICAPGCRNGWIEATPKLAHLISQEGAQKSGGAPGQLVSTFLCDMLERGDLQRHVREVLRPAYEARWRTLVRAVREVLGPLGVEMPAPHGSDGNDNGGGGAAGTGVGETGKETGPEVERAGGYFVWLTLPPGISARKIARRCLDEENLIVAGGWMFEVTGDESQHNKFDGSIRLCFAWEAEEELREGIARLSRALARN